MLADLRTANKVVGVKQSKKAVKDGIAAIEELGDAVGIDVGAAVVTVLR